MDKYPDEEDLHDTIAHLQAPSASGEDMIDMIGKNNNNNKNKNLNEEQILHLLAERSENMQTIYHSTWRRLSFQRWIINGAMPSTKI